MTSAWNLWAAQCLIEECIRFGIKRFFICPGSRSAPLTLAVERHPEAIWSTHFDERGSGFLALGFASASATTAAVITTSGSAVANLLPAVVEAAQADTGLLLLTADRPPELIDCGANQAIRQPGIFSHFVRAAINLSVPDAEFKPSSMLAAVDKVLQKSSAGPVHINCPFREPLYPAQLQPGVTAPANASSWPELAECPEISNSWLSGTDPYFKTSKEQFISQQQSKSKDYAAIVPADLSQHCGIIVAGQLTPAQGNSLVVLARCLNWPVLADLHSHCRAQENPAVIARYGFWLDSLRAREILGGADLVLQVGARITDGRLQRWLREAAPQEHWLVANSEFCPDPDHRVTHWIREDIGTYISLVMADVAAKPLPNSENPLLKELAGIEQTCEMVLADWFDGQHALTEVGVCRQLSSLLPAGSQCFTGNSLPIRIGDLINKKRQLRWFSQRGASGIDGLIAHAYGIHLAGTQPTTLLIGDLSLLHDLNSLALLGSVNARQICAVSAASGQAADDANALASKAPAPFVVVVVNNNGGNIFRFLPVDEAQRTELFQTPHGLVFDQFCGGFGLSYAKPRSLLEFSAAYQRALKNPKATVIEILVEENGAFDELADLRERILRQL